MKNLKFLDERTWKTFSTTEETKSKQMKSGPGAGEWERMCLPQSMTAHQLSALLLSSYMALLEMVRITCMDCSAINTFWSKKEMDGEWQASVEMNRVWIDRSLRFLITPHLWLY